LGIEHLVLQDDRAVIPLKVLLTGESDDLPYVMPYTLWCDERWHTRFLSIKVLGGATLIIHGGGEGHWTVEELNYIPKN
jgi:hypothetical protein